MIPDTLGQGMKRKMASRMLRSDRAEAVLDIAATAEHDLLAELQRTHDLLDLDHLDEVPAPADRREQLRQMWLAMLEDRFPQWWVEHCCPRLENPGEAAQYADLSDEEWQEQKAEWAARYRRNGLEGDDDELAEAHVRKRYDVDLRTFRHLVVTWPENRVADEVEGITAGGVRAAKEGLERVNDELAEREDTGA